MKCFAFFIITWALVASVALDNKAQVSVLPQYMYLQVVRFVKDELFHF